MRYRSKRHTVLAEGAPRGVAEALVLIGDRVHQQVGDSSVLDALDVASLRQWLLPENRPLRASLTHGDGTRVHAVITPLGGGRELHGLRLVALSRKPQFALLCAALDSVIEAGKRGIAEARVAAKNVLDGSSSTATRMHRLQRPQSSDDPFDDAQPTTDADCASAVCSDAACAAALARLSGEAIVQAWAGLLLEQRIALRAGDNDHLAPLAAAIVSCVEPIAYAHVYAPVLPSTDAIHLLSAPVPFIVGIDARDRAAWRDQKSAVDSNTPSSPFERSAASRVGDDEDDSSARCALPTCFSSSLTGLAELRESENLCASKEQSATSNEILSDECEGFDDAMRDDGVAVVDVDSGVARLPKALSDTLAGLASKRTWDQLARKVGRALREEGAARACTYLQSVTRSLFAPRMSTAERTPPASVAVGRLEWIFPRGEVSPAQQQQPKMGGRASSTAATNFCRIRSSASVWAEFDGVAFWAYETADHHGSYDKASPRRDGNTDGNDIADFLSLRDRAAVASAGVYPLIWLPIESLESVSPLDDKRFELTMSHDGNAWCGLATTASPQKRRRRRFIFVGLDAVCNRSWCAALEAAAAKTRAHRRLVEMNGGAWSPSHRRIEESDEVTKLRDAVVRTQGVRLLFRRHFEAFPVDQRHEAQSKPSRENDEQVRSGKEDHERPMSPTRMMSVVFQNLFGIKAVGKGSLGRDQVVFSLSPRQQRKIHEMRRARTFGRGQMSKSFDEEDLDNLRASSEQRFPSLGSIDTFDEVCDSLASPTAQPSEMQLARVLGLALDSGGERANEPQQPGTVTSPRASHPMLSPAKSGWRSRNTSDFEERSSTAASSEDAGDREVLLKRPRMIALFPSDEEAVATSGALNAKYLRDDDDDIAHQLDELLRHSPPAPAEEKVRPTNTLERQPGLKQVVTPPAPMLRRHAAKELAPGSLTRRDASSDVSEGSLGEATSASQHRRRQRPSVRENTPIITMVGATSPRRSILRPNDVVAALLDRLIATVRFQRSWPSMVPESPSSRTIAESFNSLNSDERSFSQTSESRGSPKTSSGRSLLEGCSPEGLRGQLEAVRKSTSYAAFAEASALLCRINIEALARDDDSDIHDEGDDDAERIAFWINVHNLAVFHACIARGPPPTQRGPSIAMRYYAWSRAQKYAVGGVALSVFQIEHSILRAQSANPSSWTGWLADLARFGQKDDRRFLSPKSPPPPELSFALFTPTKSSAPLTVFRATSRLGLDAELRAHAAKGLSQVVRVHPGVSHRRRRALPPLSPAPSTSHEIPSRLPPPLTPHASHVTPLRETAIVEATPPPFRNSCDDPPAAKQQQPQQQHQQQQQQQRVFVVVLPAVVRWYARDWGHGNLDIVDYVHRLLARELEDFRLGEVIAAAHEDVVAATSRNSGWNTQKSSFALKLDYASYDWTPAFAIC
ncbi:hypothetical protein CTAYLR_010259 [Chrysophaeum taylorii]|uniref:cDENN domain-containing protein n=1 Tax=Chrysophaeum taylorii TaxID=2483200 RepID=A0AAD7UI99_9STRA|nr:hypothetical protein CTAYLR_010259 [Chrysophaeum taylorii]